MMVRAVARLLGSVAVAVTCALAIAPPVSAETIIEIDPANLAITIAPAGNTTFRVPYTIPDDSGDDGLALDVVSVVRASVPIEVGDAAITFTADVGSDSIDVAVNNDAFARAGAYTVTVKVTNSADGEPSQLIGFTVTRPSAEILLPATGPIKIERTVSFPEVGVTWEEGTTNPPVVLQVGRDTRLLELTARPLTTEEVFVTVSGSDGKPVASAKVASDLLGGKPLNPGALLELVESIEGDTPLGTVERNVQLTSPQLDQPIDIRYEITTRRTRLLIPVVIVIGLLFGLLARKLPVKFQERDAANARLRSLTLQLEALTRHPDRHIRETAAFHLAALGNSARTKNFNERADAATEALNAELARVETETAAQRTKLDAFATTIERTWSVPTHTSEHLRRVANSLDVGYERARIGDASGARGAGDDIENMLKSPLDLAIAADAQDIEDICRAIAAAIGGVSDAGLRKVAALAIDIAQATTQRPASTQPTIARIEWLHNLTARTEALAVSLSTAISVVLNTQPGLTDKTKATGARIVTQLRTVPALAALAQVRADLEAFCSRLDRKQGTVEAVAVSDAERAAVAASPALLVAAARTTARQRVAAEISEGVWRTFGWAVGIIRYGVLVVLLLVVSYGWFAGDWHGTLNDVSTIIVWAFALDVTTELVMQVAAKSPIPAVTAAGISPTPSPVAADPAATTPAPATETPPPAVAILSGDGDGSAAGDSTGAAETTTVEGPTPAADSGTVAAPVNATVDGDNAVKHEAAVPEVDQPTPTSPTVSPAAGDERLQR